MSIRERISFQHRHSKCMMSAVSLLYTLAIANHGMIWNQTCRTSNFSYLWQTIVCLLLNFAIICGYIGVTNELYTLYNTFTRTERLRLKYSDNKQNRYKTSKLNICIQKIENTITAFHLIAYFQNKMQSHKGLAHRLFTLWKGFSIVDFSIFEKTSAHASTWLTFLGCKY